VRTVNLKIDLMSPNPEYRSGKKVENTRLTLTTIAPITYNTKVNKPTFGRWMCPSIYVGKTLQGSYYVTWLAALDPDDPNTRRVREWQERDGMVRDTRVVNPIGVFFDDSEGLDAGGRGFMTLYRFAADEAAYDHGFGMFDKYNVDLVWSGLDWSKI
jgi:hypothetical protein